eukprot:jgi/Pico_ML_1/55114/g861.t1
MQYMKPKLDALAVQLAGTVGKAAPLATLAEYYQYLLVAACVMEILGPLLFMLGSDLGAKIMALFLLGVTPIMHNFWNAQGMESMIEMIMFMKNVSMLGALLMYLGMASDKSKKEKED